MNDIKNKNNFLYLINFSGRYKFLTILGCLLSALSAISAMMPFLYIWKFINALFIVLPNFSEAQNLEYYAIMALSFAILSIILNFLGLMATHLSAFRNERNMKEFALNHLSKLPLGYFFNNSSGSIRKIIDYSAASTETFLAHQLPDLVGAIVTPIVFLILLFSFNWVLGIICIIPMIIGFLLFIPMMGGKNQNFMQLYQKSLEDMNAEAVEYIRGIPVTKTFQQTIFSFKNFYKSIINYGKFASGYTLSTQLPMTSFTVSINGFFVFLIPAGILLLSSTMNTNLLLDLVFYIILTPFCGVMLNKIMMVSQDWMIAKESLKNIDNILSEEALEEYLPRENIENYSIEFNDVSFSYDGKSNVLNDINLKIKEGETIALVGPSGSGKSTIASLIPRFWDVQKGEISIGGANIKNISQKELMENISFVFQNSLLFKDTIVNNLAMGRDVSDYEVFHALKLAQCEDIIEKLPEGVETVLGKEGVYLSGGEQQRIALARAILKDAPIVVLDEATALADPENELQIQNAINKMTEGKTVIMIAHRLSTVRSVDKIYVVNEGKIIEEGSHDELVDKKGFYNNMWEEYNQSVDWKVNNKVKLATEYGSDEYGKVKLDDDFNEIIEVNNSLGGI